MWCANCQQDVPRVALAAGSPLACPRCGSEMAIRRDAAEDAAHRVPEPIACDTEAWDPSYDPWEIDAQLQHIARRLELLRAPGESAASPTGSKRILRFDSAHRSTSTGSRVPPPGKQRGQSFQGGFFLTATVWSALSLGMTFFTCGAVLAGWSIAARQQAFWDLGLPILLGGAAMLAMGFFLQIHRLGRENEAMAAQLQQMHSGRSRRRGKPAVSAPASLPVPSCQATDLRLAEIFRELNAVDSRL